MGCSVAASGAHIVSHCKKWLSPFFRAQKQSAMCISSPARLEKRARIHGLWKSGLGSVNFLTLNNAGTPQHDMA